jgi:hypothetical protein
MHGFVPPHTCGLIGLGRAKFSTIPEDSGLMERPCNRKAAHDAPIKNIAMNF